MMYLHSLRGKFKVIALSETWLDEKRGCDFYIDGYELYYINRSNKKPGRVALFVNCDLKCKQLKDMYMVIDDLMETVTVELEMERRSNIIVRCVYIENLEH